MIKNTPKTIKGNVIENLRRAQKQVEFILRHGNDLLAVDNLQGVEVCALVVFSPMGYFPMSESL